MPVSPVIPAGGQESVESTPLQPPTATGGNENDRAGVDLDGRSVPRHSGPPAAVGGHVLSVGVVGQPTADVPLPTARWPSAAAPASARCFEATNSNPLQAMRQVLQQVETQRKNN